MNMYKYIYYSIVFGSKDMLWLKFDTWKKTTRFSKSHMDGSSKESRMQKELNQ